MKQKKVLLHIAANYIGNHLYGQLYSTLDRDFNQLIYIPIRKKESPRFEVSLKNGNIVFSNVIKRIHKYLYFIKIYSLIHDFKSKIQINDIEFVHAHSLFTDGVIALYLKLFKRIDYVVSVRLSDIELHYKYMYHRRFVANLIISKASKVCFVSEVYKDRLSSMMSNKMKSTLCSKSVVIPNGISEEYIKNSSNKTFYDPQKDFRLFFVGRIIKLKNIISIIKATDLLVQRGLNVNLTIIGSKENRESEYFDNFLTAISGKNYINYLGEIWDRNKIIECFSNSHLLVVPSFQELFGIVFIESISQNTPFIYGQNTGIKSYVEGKEFAIEVNQYSINDISKGIEQMMDRYNSISPFADFAYGFSWEEVVKQYCKIYCDHV